MQCSPLLTWLFKSGEGPGVRLNSYGADLFPQAGIERIAQTVA